jgi:8-oxo-dGTP diphosphatase
MLGKFKPNEFCHFCGERYPKEIVGSVALQCRVCNQWTYLNPAPVAVLLCPTVGGGLWGVRRGIEPFIGKVALPGGYIHLGEDWRFAGARELYEEINIIIADPQNSIDPVHHESTGSRTSILLFGLVRTNVDILIEPFVPSLEAQERVVIDENFEEEIAFPIHKKMIDRYFSEMR